MKQIIFLFGLFLLFSCNREELSFETTYLEVGVDKKGFISSFVDKNSSADHLPKGVSAPLLSLYKNSGYILPSSIEYNLADRNLVLEFTNGSAAIVRVENKGDYLRFELLSLEPRDEIEAVVWGPYPTGIDRLIGETICVVRDGDFAIGLQALNTFTIEGLPDNGGGGMFIEPLPGQQLPDSLKDKIGQRVSINVNTDGDLPDYVRIYRGNAAVKKPYGSELRLFAWDKEHMKDAGIDFIGTAIAMFGCPGPLTLDVIEKIELGEDLPHPMLNGQWVKRSAIPGQAYLLNEVDPLPQAIKYAKACGFSLIHIGDVFESWGHFGLKTERFPNGAEDIRKATDAAHREGIRVGVHTLTMFTTVNDAYVTPVPSDSLRKNGSSVLTAGIGEEDAVIFIEDPEYFRNPDQTHTVKIGKELVNYRKVSDDEPWRLLDCERGVFGTRISQHEKGAVIDKLMNDSYRGFYPDIRLQDAYAKRLAEVCNETGIDLMDFDGMAGQNGIYGDARFFDLWYSNLDRYRMACGSGTWHYYWHVYAFMNWGEPWYKALRESQVNYRIENQRYFERNLMPGMLGWFTLNPEFRPEEVEWIQARSAGFDAGYLLRVDHTIEKSGFKDQLLEAVKEWQKAREADAFSPEQKERLKNPKNEFHLEKISENAWDLYPVNLLRGFKHEYRLVQTGEPVASNYTVNNPFREQRIQFYISADAAEGSQTSAVSDIELIINNYQTLEINESLRSGDRVYCDGEKVYLCDNTWNIKRVLETNNLPVFEKGDNRVTITSAFGTNSPLHLEIEFKSVGEAERVGE